MEIIDTKDYNDYVHIDLNVIYACNMKCSYCYARKENPWNVMMKKDILNLCLDRIRKTKDCHVNILGGEPSLYPFLKYTIEQLEGMPYVKLVKIYTNGIKDLRKYKSAKVKLVYTTHGKEAQDWNNFGEILAKIEPDDYLTIMFEKDENLPKFYEQVKHLENIEGNFIQYNDIPDLSPHPLDFLQNYCLVNGKKTDQREYVKIRTKGLFCNINYFSVDYDGTISNCLQSKGLKNIKEIDRFESYYLKCNKEYCEQICYMMQRKYDI